MFHSLSVLVPTRKRLERLQALVESYYETQAYVGAELVFRVDDDDQQTQAFLRNYYDFTVVVGPRYDGYRSLPRFFEEMRAVCTGDLLMTGNDDMVFRTALWPEKVLQVANQYPDGLFCLGVDTFNAGNYPFAIVSRKAVEIMGQIHDPRIYWGDVYLRDVMAHFSRAIRIPEVRIDHDWAGAAPDETFREARQDVDGAWTAAHWAIHQQCVADAVAKLEGALCSA